MRNRQVAQRKVVQFIMMAQSMKFPVQPLQATTLQAVLMLKVAQSTTKVLLQTASELQQTNRPLAVII